MFEGFELRRVDGADGVPIRLRIGGAGPPLLLLHGNPQTHAMWHKVAPRLAEHFTVVASDLRGYGESGKPPPSSDHAPYAKRAMAADQVAVMKALGFPRFRLAGHDRGGRVSHRLCLDHPQAVERVALLDIVPTLHAFETMNADVAMGYYHWLWLAQPHDTPECLINADPEFWWKRHTGRGQSPDTFSLDALADYLACVKNPDTVMGICEDYRAAATIDLVHDRASREAGQRIACPALVLWGGRGRLGGWYDVLEVWRRYATDVRGRAIPSGHYIPEENPAETLEEFLAFFG